MLNHIRAGLVTLVFFTLLTGVVYPLAMTGLAQVAFPRQANGSLLTESGKVIGSELLGMPFDDPRYFWSRPSATAPMPYNAGASSGSNLGPQNPALLKAVKQRMAALHAADPGHTAPVPVDLVTASASGLDPHISPAAADYQVQRVARTRKMSPERVRQLLVQNTESRQWGFLGEPRVTVLKLNMDLDKSTTGVKP